MDRIQNRVGSDFLYNQFKIQFFRRSRCFEDDNLNHFTKFNCESALRNLLYPWIYTLRLKTIFLQTSRFPTIAKLWISILLCSVEKVNNNYVNFNNFVGTFFKLLKENCPNLIKLNLGSQYQSRSVDTIYKNLFSMAGLEVLKELNVDFTFFYGGDGNRDGKSNLEWFLGLINDCNNIETLSLIDLMVPFIG